MGNEDKRLSEVQMVTMFSGLFIGVCNEEFQLDFSKQLY